MIWTVFTSGSLSTYKAAPAKQAYLSMVERLHQNKQLGGRHYRWFQRDAGQVEADGNLPKILLKRRL